MPEVALKLDIGEWLIIPLLMVLPINGCLAAKPILFCFTLSLIYAVLSG